MKLVFHFSGICVLDLDIDVFCPVSNVVVYDICAWDWDGALRVPSIVQLFSFSPFVGFAARLF